MPKYRNTEKFIQSIRINGVRVLVRSNQVIFSEKELDLTLYKFLEKVDDAVRTTAVPQKPTVVKPVAANVEEVGALRKTIEEMKSSFNKELTSFAKKEEVAKDLQETKEKILEETPTVEPDEIKGLQDKIKALSEFYRQLKDDKSLMDKLNELNTNVELCLRRLEVMRKAVEVIDAALHNLELEVYENGEPFIIDEEEFKKG